MGCLHELFRKIKNRRGGDEDEGLPQSPEQSSTADLIENGLARRSLSESEGSLGSMESLDELPDGFFQSNWSAVAGSRRKVSDSADDLAGSSMDLDAVGSTSSLVSAGTRHRLAVRQTGRRVSSKHKRVITAGMTSVPSILPEVEEEKPTILVEREEPKPIEEPVRIDVVAEVEPSRSPEPEPVKLSTPEPVKSEPSTPVEEVKPIVPVVLKPVSPVVSPMTEDPKKDDSPSEEGKMFGGVVLRRTGKLAQIADEGTIRRPNPTRSDPTKRQTIAVDSTVFIDRKVSLREPKAKDDLHKPKVTEDGAEDGNSEFAAMFNKLKKRSSQKHVQVEHEEETDKPSTAVKLKVAEVKVVEVKAQVKSEPKAEVKPKTVAVKPAITASKPSEISKSPPRASTEKPAISVKTEKPAAAASAAASKPAAVNAAASKPEAVKPVANVIEKKTSPVNNNVEKKVSIETPAVITIAKPTVSDKKTGVSDKPAEKKVSVAEKKVSVPDKKVSVAEKKVSLVDKKPAESDKKPSTVTPPVVENSKENQDSVNTTKSPGLRRTESKKPVAVESNNASDAQPAWIAMARRKTKNWDQKEKELEDKDHKDSSNRAVKRDLIIDGKENSSENPRSSRVLDLINNFQNAKLGVSN